MVFSYQNRGQMGSRYVMYTYKYIKTIYIYIYNCYFFKYVPLGQSVRTPCNTCFLLQAWLLNDNALCSGGKPST